MFRRIIICLPLTVFLLTISFADAQQTGKILRIGFLDRKHCVRYGNPRGGVPTGDAQAWLDRGKEYRHRV